MTRDELIALAKAWAEKYEYEKEYTRWAFVASDVAAVSRAFLEADAERERLMASISASCVPGTETILAERDAARAEVERLRRLTTDQPDHGNEYAIVCHYKGVAEKAESELSALRARFVRIEKIVEEK